MEGSKRLVLLILGLCLVFYYVDATIGNVRLLGNNLFNPYEDLSGKLRYLKNKQSQLENELTKPRISNRWRLEMELREVKSDIQRMEATLKVPYKDFVKSTTEQRQQFEREKAEIRRQLEMAENKRIQANNELYMHQKDKSEKIGQYQQNLETLTEQRNRLAREYAKFTDAFYEQEQKIKEERDAFLTEKARLQQILDEAKRKHALALEAITATPAESHKPFNLPEQDEINKLRRDITEFNGLKNRHKLKEGLETTKKNIEELLARLYEEGKFSPQTSREDLKTALAEMERNTKLKREEQDNRRKELVEKMKEKALTSDNDEELESLQKTNAEVAALDKFQQEINRRSTYLKGILETTDLLKECSDAIRDANERNMANVWADAIQGAKDSPLAMLWKKTVKNGKGKAKQNGTKNGQGGEAKMGKSNSFGENAKKAFNDAKHTFGKIGKLGKDKSGKKKAANPQ